MKLTFEQKNIKGLESFVEKILAQYPTSTVNLFNVKIGGLQPYKSTT